MRAIAESYLSKKLS